MPTRCQRSFFYRLDFLCKNELHIETPHRIPSSDGRSFIKMGGRRIADFYKALARVPGVGDFHGHNDSRQGEPACLFIKKGAAYSWKVILRKVRRLIKLHIAKDRRLVKINF